MIKALLPLFSLILTVACSASAPADGLVFDASSGKAVHQSKKVYNRKRLKRFELE